MLLGIIFYQNEDGDVLDIQADIIGPGKSTASLKASYLSGSLWDSTDFEIFTSSQYCLM